MELKHQCSLVLMIYFCHKAIQEVFALLFIMTDSHCILWIGDASAAQHQLDIEAKLEEIPVRASWRKEDRV